MKLRVLDLFAGIGGFSLGLKRTGGFETTAFCEIDPFCRRVLQKHWPEVPIYEDVRQLNKQQLAADGIAADVITGGFPCQDISAAGRKEGIEGEKSSLWFDFHRLIAQVLPGLVIVENSSELRHRGLGVVLKSLASIGYDAQWHCIPACYAGANHLRDRMWIIAYPSQETVELFGRPDEWSEKMGKNSANVDRQWQLQPERLECSIWRWLGDGFEKNVSAFVSSDLPVLGREIHGIPNRIHRVAALGNAVVPQIVEMIGSAILEASR